MWALKGQRRWRGEGGGTLTLSADAEGAIEENTLERLCWETIKFHKGSRLVTLSGCTSHCG